MRPVLARQPRGDGGAPLRLPGAVRRGVQLERRRAHPAAHVGQTSAEAMIPEPLQVVRHRPGGSAVPVGSGRAGPCGGTAARMAASSSVGVAPASCAAAVEPADVPTVRSAPVTSRPASNRPATTPISQALPVDPPPPRTSARSPAAGCSGGRRPPSGDVPGEEGDVRSWESPFANCVAGAPSGDWPSRAIVDCRGAPATDTAFMGVTSCRRITIAGT